MKKLLFILVTLAMIVLLASCVVPTNPPYPEPTIIPPYPGANGVSVVVNAITQSNSFSDYFAAVWDTIHEKIIWLVGLTLLDIIVGLILSLINGTFDLEKIVSFLKSDGLPIFGWLVSVLLLTIPAQFLPENFVFPATETVIYGGVVLKIIGSILKSLGDAGILSEYISKVVGKE